MNTIRLDSNWWYGVLIPPVLELLGGGGILVAGRLGLIQDGANPLTILVPGFTLLAGLFLIPVFALCLFFDARAANQSNTSWNPRPVFWGVGSLLLPLAGVIAFSYSLLVPIATVYLYRRFSSTSIVTDLTADDKPAIEIDNELDESQSTTGDDSSNESSGRVSNWWYGIAVPIVAYIVFLGAILLLGIIQPDQVQPGSRFAWLSLVITVFTVLAIFAQFVLTPVFSLSLFLDQRRVRASDAVDWHPNRFIWSAIALVHLISMIVTQAMLLSLAGGIVYLLRRHRRVGRPLCHYRFEEM